jgi:hypothetical protein
MQWIYTRPSLSLRPPIKRPGDEARPIIYGKELANGSEDHPLLISILSLELNCLILLITLHKLSSIYNPPYIV